MGRFGEGDLLSRTEQYAIRAIKLFRHLRQLRNEEGWVIGRQYFRAATSVGANLVEADVAESRKDFAHKCGIALKEARECRYWLGLMLLSETVGPERLDALIQETDELVAVLSAIIVRSRRNYSPKV